MWLVGDCGRMDGYWGEMGKATPDSLGTELWFVSEMQCFKKYVKFLNSGFRAECRSVEIFCKRPDNKCFMFGWLLWSLVSFLFLLLLPTPPLPQM